MAHIQIINNELVSEVSDKASSSPRKRMNHNFHEKFDDPVNRMLNALEPETYCRPHIHENPDKAEIFLVLKGKIGMLIFNELGKVIKKEIIDPKNGIFGIDIPAGHWHTMVSLEHGSVAYEVKQGPYAPAKPEDFAPWAPEEGSEEAKAYLEVLRANFN